MVVSVAVLGLIAPLLCSATIPAVENGIGGFRGYFANVVDIDDVVLEGQTVDLKIEAEGVSDDGRIAMEAKDFGSYVVALTPDSDDYKSISLDTYSFSVKQISNQGVVTGKATGGQGNTKQVYTWSQETGVVFYNKETSDGISILETDGVSISRNGRSLAGDAKIMANGKQIDNHGFYIRNHADYSGPKGVIRPLPLIERASMMDERDYFLANETFSKFKALSVNDDGIVVGAFETETGLVGGYVYHPDENQYDFFTPQDFTDLEECSMGADSCGVEAKYVNNDNVVIIHTKGNPLHTSIFWRIKKPDKPDQFADLVYVPSVTSDRMKIDAINNNGIATGHTFQGEDNARVAAVVDFSKPDSPMLLNELMDPEAGNFFEMCKDISDSGIMACRGTDSTGSLAAFQVVPILKGDMDLNMKVDIADLELLSKRITSGDQVVGRHNIPLTHKEYLEFYDMNGDGVVNRDDILVLSASLAVDFRLFMESSDDEGFPSRGATAGISIAAVSVCVCVWFAFVIGNVADSIILLFYFCTCTILLVALCVCGLMIACLFLVAPYVKFRWLYFSCSSMQWSVLQSTGGMKGSQYSKTPSTPTPTPAMIP